MDDSVHQYQALSHSSWRSKTDIIVTPPPNTHTHRLTAEQFSVVFCTSFTKLGPRMLC